MDATRRSYVTLRSFFAGRDEVPDPSIRAAMIAAVLGVIVGGLF